MQKGLFVLIGSLLILPVSAARINGYLAKEVRQIETIANNFPAPRVAFKSHLGSRSQINCCGEIPLNKQETIFPIILMIGELANKLSP